MRKRANGCRRSRPAADRADQARILPRMNVRELAATFRAVTPVSSRCRRCGVAWGNGKARPVEAAGG